MPTRRLLLVQRSFSDTPGIGALAGVLQTTYSAAGVDIGVVQRAGRDKPLDVQGWFAAAGRVKHRILDPEAWARNDQLKELHSLQSPAWPHLLMNRGSRGSTAERDWLDQVLAAQTQFSTTILLSPGLWQISAAGIAEEIRLRSRMQARSEAPVWLNIAASCDLLIDPLHRARLVATIARDAATLPGIYLRARIPSISPAYTEPRRKGYVSGLAEFVTRMTELDVPLLLPNTGMTGWVMTALGANGFGTGGSLAQRVWLPNKGGPQGTPRYYEPHLVHTVTRDVHVALAQDPSYPHCPCAYCAALQPNTVALAAWQRDLATMHYLDRVAHALAALPPSRAQQSAKAVVGAAIAESARLKAQIPDPLVGNRPTHLPIWDLAL